MSHLAEPFPESLQRDNQRDGRLRPSSPGPDISAAQSPASPSRPLPAREIPRPQESSSALRGEAPLNHRGRCISVLLAEERTIVRQGIGALLAFKQDIAVVGQATDCRQVLELAEKLRPDVVIITISLALRNGLESLRRILAASCGSRVLVLIPHNDNNAFVEHVVASGAAGCLTEQAGSQLLAIAVRHVCESKWFFGRGNVRLAPHPPQPRHKGPSLEKDITQLTTRELEVLQLIAAGNANKQTASKLSLSIKTVEKHRQHLMDKLGIHETATLTRYAVYSGIA